MDTKEFQVGLRFTTPLLGSVPLQKDIFVKYIQTKARELDPELAANEVESIQDVAQRGATGFFKDKDDKAFLFDYQVKGFLNEAAKVLKDTWPRKKKAEMEEGAFDTFIGAKVKNYVFVTPRQIPLMYEGEITQNARPLRGMTAQGPRISLVTSDQVDNASITFNLTVLTLSGLKTEHLVELLSFGKFQGLGGWRTGGWGRFEVTEFEEIYQEEVVLKKPKRVKALRGYPACE